MLRADHFSKRLEAENRDELEVQLSWILVPLFSMRMSKNTPSIRRFDNFFGHFWPLSNICRLRKSMFCLIYEKSQRSILQGELAKMTYWWRRMKTMRCARRHARGHELQRCRQRVELLVDLYSKLACSTQSKQLRIELLYRYKPAKTRRITMLIYFLYFKLYVTLSGANPRCYGEIHSGIETPSCT